MSNRTVRQLGKSLIIAAFALLHGTVNSWAGDKIVAFGDSLTAGVPYLQNGGGCTNCGGYELFLQYYLNWEGKGRTVYNYGVAGEYLTFQGINRIDSVLKTVKPSHVLILEGTNDLSLYVDPATVAYNVYKVAYKALQAGVKPVVGTILPDTRYGTDWKKVGKTNSYIKSYVGSNSQICLSDQHSGIEPYWNSGYNYDKLHPNYYGYWIMGLYWYYALYYCS
ncbi:MAG: SGNH/GDSL hydrolase family protein [Candidatus Electronema sp. V4]|uniref:SGNH/GDSL hydrolase family protein n=1 Tax=Candidatus Electronema sp. V4 TaxID=3454756 RepID=UPI0040557ED0